MPFSPEQIQQLQREAIQRQLSTLNNMHGAASFDSGNQARRNQLLQQLNQMNSGSARAAMAGPSASGPAKDPAAELAASRTQAFANTEGRANELRQDPNVGAALGFLRGAVAGDNVPFGQQMQANYLTNAADTAGAAERQQSQQLQEQIAANGGSITDPSAQAALRELASRRQGQIAGAQNQIGMTAGQTNFNAQMQGANALGSQAGANNAQINQLLGHAADIRQGDFANLGGQPNLGQQAGGFGGGIQVTQIGQPPRAATPIGMSPTPFAGNQPPGTTYASRPANAQVPMSAPPRTPQGGAQPAPAPAPSPVRTGGYDMTGYGGTPAPQSEQYRGDRYTGGAPVPSTGDYYMRGYGGAPSASQGQGSGIVPASPFGPMNYTGNFGLPEKPKKPGYQQFGDAFGPLLGK